ncbi:MAG: DinB family protein [Flavobacteriales bacterium]|nr:MAG: DinB family protein [Flavobacteriales bacterium]
MEHSHLIDQLAGHAPLFARLFGCTHRTEHLHRAAPDKWCLLEAACHLRDEEKEDFRARVKHVLETPDQPMPKIDPQAWITERKYLEQDYTAVLNDFLAERGKSVAWLRGLHEPAWKNFYLHPKVGPITAEFLLANWVAHDLHHIRQVNAMRYAYLKASCGVGLDYAGQW